MTQLFSDVTEQARRTRKQGHTAQQLRRQPDVSKRGTSHSGTIERQRAAKHLGMNTTNGLEQAQVWTPQALPLGDLDDHGGARIHCFMHWVAQSRNEAASSPLLGHCPSGKRVPLLVGLWDLARDACPPVGHKA